MYKARKSQRKDEPIETNLAWLLSKSGQEFATKSIWNFGQLSFRLTQVISNLEKQSLSCYCLLMLFQKLSQGRISLIHNNSQTSKKFLLSYGTSLAFYSLSVCKPFFSSGFQDVGSSLPGGMLLPRGAAAEGLGHRLVARSGHWAGQRGLGHYPVGRGKQQSHWENVLLSRSGDYFYTFTL